MARMLGRARYRPIDPRDDNLKLDGPLARRQQRRRERIVIEYEERPPVFFDARDLAVIASFEDSGDCRHGCNGSPCGSERCTFICHEATP